MIVDLPTTIERGAEIDAANGFNPIPLTEELIFKAGFNKDSDGNYKLGNCMYWVEEGFLQLAIGYSVLMNCPCKYVHQLQNLYFALTGEELIFNI